MEPKFLEPFPGALRMPASKPMGCKHGFKFYNLGPVGDYGYKSLFVTDFEPIYALALTDPDHPLAKDHTSPLNIDFKPEEWNQVYRNANTRF